MKHEPEKGASQKSLLGNKSYASFNRSYLAN